jgi:hypothetical protein
MKKSTGMVVVSEYKRRPHHRELSHGNGVEEKLASKHAQRDAEDLLKMILSY